MCGGDTDGPWQPLPGEKRPLSAAVSRRSDGGIRQRVQHFHAEVESGPGKTEDADTKQETQDGSGPAADLPVHQYPRW